MIKRNVKSHNGFKYGVISFLMILVLIMITAVINTLKFSFSLLLIGFLTILIGYMGIIGLIKSLKGIKEPNTSKKIIGLILNIGIVSLFISLIIANFLDIYKAFN
ncbi:hypothetical protein [Aquimarina rhabdastrellae]